MKYNHDAHYFTTIEMLGPSYSKLKKLPKMNRYKLISEIMKISNQDEESIKRKLNLISYSIEKSISPIPIDSDIPSKCKFTLNRGRKKD